MQTEESETEGKRIMPETRFNKFPALSVDPRVEMSRSASGTYDRIFFLPVIGKRYLLNVRLTADHLYGKLLFTWLSLVVSMIVSFCAVLFPMECLG